MGAKNHQIWARLAGFFSAILALAFVFVQPNLLNAARDRAFDQFQRLSPRVHDKTSVRVVEIDDEALERYGQWPWPRHQLAAIVEKLNDAGAAAIVFDIILAEPDRTSPANVVKSWLDAPELAPIVSELQLADLSGVDHDRRLASAFASAPSVLHLTASAGDTGGPCPPALEQSRVYGMQAKDLARVAPSFRQIIPPLAQFRVAASGEGFAKAALTQDAIVRSVPLIALACGGQEIYPSLAIEALRVAAPRLDPQYAPHEFIEAASKNPCRTHVTGIEQKFISEVILCRLHLPTTEDGQLWVHYSSRSSMEKRRLSLVSVLEGDPTLLAEAVHGRIVLVGASAEGLRDVLITPLGDERPGVHVHAEVIEQVLTKKTLYRSWDLMRPVEILSATLISLLLLIFLPQLSAAIGFGVWSVLSISLLGGSYFAFSVGHMLIDPITPGLVLTSSFVGAFVVMFQQEQIARKFVRGAFGKFLSPLILDRLESDPSLLKLEGESREITAFFSDIRGFTTISEQLTPQQVTTLLNQYFTPMTRIVVENKGLVDKYMGDGLAAMWNAPIDVPDHPALACRAALKMLDTLDSLNAAWRANEYLPVPEIKIGIGLHTEEASVGNFGSDDHLEYSMLGDMVNLTSRLESLTKQYRVPIIISSDVWARAPQFAAVPLGSFIVKGRTDPTVIFALIGDEKLAARATFQAFRKIFEAGVTALEGGDGAGALEHFAACAKGETFGLGATLDYFSARAAE